MGKRQSKLWSGLCAALSLATVIQPTVALDKEAHWQQTIERAYGRSVQDAADAEAHEISPLMPIVPGNKDLVWQDIDGVPHVKVVTWTSWDGYDELIGSSTILSREIWTTPAPQVRDIIQKLMPNSEPETTTLRLEQLLGLPPNNGKTRWVELWVKPNDLFRPCPDAEITDEGCDIYFPEMATEEHRSWIVNLILSSYGDRGYPWTRLGYTYDWGGMDTEVGANELVVKGGATVVIESVSTNETYFAQPDMAN